MRLLAGTVCIIKHPEERTRIFAEADRASIEVFPETRSGFSADAFPNLLWDGKKIVGIKGEI